jgi:hypothetical protein
MGLKTRAVAAALLVTCLAVAVYRTLSAPRTPSAALTGAARERVAAFLAVAEPDLQHKAALEFPGDLWSQSDAYGALEQDKIREATRNENVNLGSVIDVLDADLRAHRTPGRSVSAAPCKPRPFYD